MVWYGMAWHEMAWHGMADWLHWQILAKRGEVIFFQFLQFPSYAVPPGSSFPSEQYFSRAFGATVRRGR